MSDAVCRVLRDPAALARVLGVALGAHLLIHYAGLRAALGTEGRITRNLREAAALDLSEQVDNYGEIQPIGILEETIGVLVTVVFVAWLVGALLELRRHRLVAGLPEQASRVVVLALVRPRRVVDAIWRGTAGPSSGPSGPPGSVMIDVLWPVWLVTNVAIQVGDHLSARADTLREAQTATWVEAAAELGFLVTGTLLVLLVIVLAGRLRAAARGQAPPKTPPVGALVAIPLVGMVLLPVLGFGLVHAYASGERGPSLVELRTRVTVDRVWQAREQAAAKLDLRGLAATTAGPALQADRAGIRRQRRAGRRVRWARELAGVTALTDPRNATALVVVANALGGPGWTAAQPGETVELLVLGRSRPGRPWAIELETPFTTWPWGPIRAAGPARWEPAAAELLGASLGGSRRVAIDAASIVAVPMTEDRTLVCGAGLTPGARLVQACAASAADGPPLLLGRLDSAPDPAFRRSSRSG